MDKSGQNKGEDDGRCCFLFGIWIRLDLELWDCGLGPWVRSEFSGLNPKRCREGADALQSVDVLRFFLLWL